MAGYRIQQEQNSYFRQLFIDKYKLTESYRIQNSPDIDHNCHRQDERDQRYPIPDVVHETDAAHVCLQYKTHRYNSSKFFVNLC